MNHNILNKIFDKIELSKEVYKATIKKHDDLDGRSIDTAYFYKKNDALDYIKFNYMYRFSEGQKREISFSHNINMGVDINQMVGYNLLAEHPTFRNLTDEQKASKVFDTILRDLLLNGYLITLNIILREELQHDRMITQVSTIYKIVTKSVN